MAGCLRRHNWTAYPWATQFGCGVVRAIVRAPPADLLAKLYERSCCQLNTLHHTPPPAQQPRRRQSEYRNPWCSAFLIITVAPQPQYVLASQTWVRRAPPSCSSDDEDEDGVTTVLDTPPRPITLAIRSPEAPPPPSRAPSPPELMTVSRSFPEGPFVPQPRQRPQDLPTTRAAQSGSERPHKVLQRCSCAG